MHFHGALGAVRRDSQGFVFFLSHLSHLPNRSATLYVVKIFFGVNRSSLQAKGPMRLLFIYLPLSKITWMQRIMSRHGCPARQPATSSVELHEVRRLVSSGTRGWWRGSAKFFKRCQGLFRYPPTGFLLAGGTADVDGPEFTRVDPGEHRLLMYPKAIANVSN